MLSSPMSPAMDGDTLPRVALGVRLSGLPCTSSPIAMAHGAVAFSLPMAKDAASQVVNIYGSNGTYTVQLPIEYWLVDLIALA